MLSPYPSWLNAGDNSWQMTAATFVGLMSIPALAVLYGGLVQKKWAINTVMMVFTTFCLVLITWVLWAFKLGFGTPLLHTYIGDPRTILGHAAEQGQASIPLVNPGVPSWHLPRAPVEYFQSCSRRSPRSCSSAASSSWTKAPEQNGRTGKDISPTTWLLSSASSYPRRSASLDRGNALCLQGLSGLLVTNVTLRFPAAPYSARHVSHARVSVVLLGCYAGGNAAAEVSSMCRRRSAGQGWLAAICRFGGRRGPRARAFAHVTFT